MGDQAYRSTPIGKHAGAFLDELRFQNYSPRTVEERERIYRLLSEDFAYKQPFEVTLGDLKAWLAGRWGDAAANTKATYTSHVRALFLWLLDNEVIDRDPAGRKLKSPRNTETVKQSHAQDTIRKLVIHQEWERDRVALLLMYWCALRRFELRQVQFRHIDLTHRLLTGFIGKGGKLVEQNIPGPLALDLERHILNRQPAADEYLLYPFKRGRRGSYPYYTREVVWEDRLSPLSLSAMDKWFQRCRERAGLPDVDMHELRHSAGTHFHEQGRDLVATQKFLRHASAATTERTYIHIDRRAAVDAVQRQMSNPMEDAS
jgi:integrase